MADHDDAAAVGDVPQELEDVLHLHVVEMRRGLVREDERRVVSQGSGNRDPLLLTTGKVARPVVPTVPQTDLLEQPVGALAGGRGAETCGPQRNLDVLARGQARNEIERLEDDSDAVPAVLGQRSARERRDLDASELHAASGRREDRREDRQQRRLAATAGAEE